MSETMSILILEIDRMGSQHRLDGILYLRSQSKLVFYPCAFETMASLFPFIFRKIPIYT